VVNSPINRILSKQQVLDRLTKGVIAHVSFEQDIEFLDRHRDTVVVMGNELVTDAKVVTDAKGATAVRRRFTNMRRREGVAWRFFARHAHIVTTD
jgi:hypothetical protein